MWAKKTKINITLVIMIIITTSEVTCADSGCEEIEVKSEERACAAYHYDDPEYICEKYEYPTLYKYLLCTKTKLERDSQLNPLSDNSNHYKYIMFENSIVSVISVGVFSSFTTVEQLFLNSSEIHTIEPGAFSGMIELEELHLEDNNITTISRGTLNSLMKLKILDMSKNHITNIENNSFHGLLALRKLNLAHNQLTNVSYATFSSLGALKVLVLSYNHITKIEENTFSSTQNLEQLLIQNNFLEEISFLMFKNLSVLTVVDVSSNKLDQIDFNFLPDSLSKLNLSNNELSDLKNLKKNGSSLFRESNNLNELDLSRNYVSKIEVNSFQNLSNLVYLYLHHNQINHIPIGSFKDLISLKFLYLSYNYLTNLDFGTFTGLAKLEELYLDHNKLLGVHENSFHVLRQLKTLYLNDNAINSLRYPSLLVRLRNLKIIALNHNNWTCNALLDILHTLKSNEIQMIEGSSFNVPNIDGIPCTNEIVVKVETSSTIGYIETATSEVSKEKFLTEFDFRNTSFYEYFDRGFKNSSFYIFFNNNYLQEGLNDTKFFSLKTNESEGFDKYFDKVTVFMFVVVVLLVFLITVQIFVALLIKQKYSKRGENNFVTEAIELL